MKTTTEDTILKYLKKNKQVKPGVLANHLHISRVAIHKQLKKMLFKEKEKNPHYLWDYDVNELRKTEQGRIKILERMINYGPGEGEKIPLDQVRKYWEKLELNYLARRLFELLIWGKYQSSPKNKKFSWM